MSVAERGGEKKKRPFGSSPPFKTSGNFEFWSNPAGIKKRKKPPPPSLFLLSSGGRALAEGSRKKKRKEKEGRGPAPPLRPLLTVASHPYLFLVHHQKP